MPVLGSEMVSLISQAFPHQRPHVLRLVCDALHDLEGLRFLQELSKVSDRDTQSVALSMSKTHDEVWSAPLQEIASLFVVDESINKAVLPVPQKYVYGLISDEVSREISGLIRSWWPEETVRAKQSRKVADMIDEGYFRIAGT